MKPPLVSGRDGANARRLVESTRFARTHGGDNAIVPAAVEGSLESKDLQLLDTQWGHEPTQPKGPCKNNFRFIFGSSGGNEVHPEPCRRALIFFPEDAFGLE